MVICIRFKRCVIINKSEENWLSGIALKLYIHSWYCSLSFHWTPKCCPCTVENCSTVQCHTLNDKQGQSIILGFFFLSPPPILKHFTRSLPENVADLTQLWLKANAIGRFNNVCNMSRSCWVILLEVVRAKWYNIQTTIRKYKCRNILLHPWTLVYTEILFFLLFMTFVSASLTCNMYTNQR